RFAGISLMGGGVGIGNVTPAAEFNLWADPEAAQMVLAAGVPLTMIGLNLTHQVRMGPAEAERLRRAGTATSVMVADILEFYSSSTRSALGAGGAAIHDPCAVLHVTHPGLIETITRPVAVETTGQLTRGMTVVDERLQPRSPDDPTVGPYNPHVDVAYGIDVDRAIELIIDAAVAPLT
ncbi:MAG: nucleoside hydrolase, partial [Acidimicrobiales bacterium]